MLEPLQINTGIQGLRQAVKKSNGNVLLFREMPCGGGPPTPTRSLGVIRPMPGDDVPEIAAQKELDRADQIGIERKARQRAIEVAARQAAIPPRFITATFATFKTPTAEHRAARDACEDYARNFDYVLPLGSCLVMSGTPGTGKTHLACAILSSIIAKGYTGLICTQGEMLRRIRATYSGATGESEGDAIEAFIKPDLLVIDEIGVAIGDPSKRIAQLRDVIGGRYDAQKPTVILSNATPEGIEGHIGTPLWERVTDFGSSSIIIVMRWPTYRRQDGR
jgi:DNA replication protein DnaC